MRERESGRDGKIGPKWGRNILPRRLLISFLLFKPPLEGVGKELMEQKTSGRKQNEWKYLGFHL